MERFSKAMHFVDALVFALLGFQQKPNEPNAPSSDTIDSIYLGGLQPEKLLTSRTKPIVTIDCEIKRMHIFFF